MYPLTPTTAEELNQWLRQHFMLFVGPPRAYFELPVSCSVKINDQEIITGGDYVHRIIYVTLVYAGPEEECCRLIAEQLRAIPSEMIFVDAMEPLFIRTFFEYGPLDVEVDGHTKRLHGRLAFWRHELNEKLLKLDSVKPQGEYVRPVPRKPQL